MIRFVTALLLGAMLTPAQQAAVPRKAPDLAIQVGPDKFMWLSEYAGKTCIVAVIMTTCPHCQYTTGVLSGIQKDYAAKGVQVIATAIEPMSSLNIDGFKKQFHPTFPVGYNDQKYVMKFLGLPENDPMFVPQLVFVDRGGTIRAQLTGDDPAMEKAAQDKRLRETLDKILSAK
ncbi:MAG TPA: TlpA disulfide reductase family protein [Bryobacteraceae bacterium]|nr:TlpA disulfide reductase family protein [Bryobacteraceae bacterium]